MINIRYTIYIFLCIIVFFFYLSTNKSIHFIEELTFLQFQSLSQRSHRYFYLAFYPKSFEYMSVYVYMCVYMFLCFLMSENFLFEFDCVWSINAMMVLSQKLFYTKVTSIFVVCDFCVFFFGICMLIYVCVCICVYVFVCISVYAPLVQY